MGVYVAAGLAADGLWGFMARMYEGKRESAKPVFSLREFVKPFTFRTHLTQP
jgi:hypothetical protein